MRKAEDNALSQTKGNKITHLNKNSDQKSVFRITKTSTSVFLNKHNLHYCNFFFSLFLDECVKRNFGGCPKVNAIFQCAEGLLGTRFIDDAKQA